MKLCCLLAAILAFLTAPLAASELIWPQNRTVFAAGETVELAVTGAPATGAQVTLHPADPGRGDVTLTVKSAIALPPYSLSPATYDVLLDGSKSGTLKIVPAVCRSSTLLSATSIPAPAGGNNAIVGNLFGFGLRDAAGQPMQDVRGRKSTGMAAMENWLASGMPALVYMYWTGFVTHKPWGTEKSWANADVQAAMRLFTFANSQRMRQYAPAIAAVGPLDEPGLGWGKTPAGGTASGFPNWDERPWYEAQGWKYTAAIADQSEADWSRYVDLRAKILEDSYRQASQDLKTVWPQAVFEGDLYAPSAIMDGTNPLNQRANDSPTTHVFFDFFGGPLSVPGLIGLEKSHDPTALVAHAMNGQLVGDRGESLPLYRELMNAMLMAGIKSNWWLNTGSLTKEEMAAVHAPAERLGPWIAGFKSHPQVAVLWGQSELVARQKPMAARESAKKGGEQIKLMVPLPQSGELSEAELQSNAYEVGGTYTNQVIYTHQALLRAGYPAHILHESILPGGALKAYKVLVVTGQQTALPPVVQTAIQDFVRAGGKVLTDKSTTISLPQPLVHNAVLSENEIRSWPLQLERLAKVAPNPREASRTRTMDQIIQPALRAVAPLRQALVSLGLQPDIRTASQDLAVARYSAGEGTLYLVLNGHEALPAREPNQNYPRYNPAPLKTSFALPPNTKGVLYEIDAVDWSRSQRLAQPSALLPRDFAAGEMKLYLSAPRAPRGLKASLRPVSGQLEVQVQLEGLKMPWPLQLELKSPTGQVLYSLFRATSAEGVFQESLPLGLNAGLGTYVLSVSSPLAGLAATAKTEFKSASVAPQELASPVQIFDQPAIQSLLKSPDPITIAVGAADQQPLAAALAQNLAAAGHKVQVQDEADVLHKVNYPRIWNAYARVVSPTAADVPLPAGAEVKREVTLQLEKSGQETVTGASGDWRQPNTLVRVAGDGWVDWLAQDQETVYEPGTKFYVDSRRQLVLVNGTSQEVTTSPEFRQRWERPWTSLTSYNGNYQLPPQLPEAYSAAGHLIVLGDSRTSQIARVLQASEILPRVVDEKSPGPGKALLQFAWSPFAVEKNVIFVGASDTAGLRAGIKKLEELAQP